MNIVTEFIIDSPLLPLVSIPDTLEPDEIECVHALCLQSDVRTFTVRIDPDDDVSPENLSALDEILETTLLGDTSDGTVYQLTVELEESISEAFESEHIDATQLESTTITDNQWHEKKLFRDYESFNEFRQSCENNDISFELVSISSGPSVSDGIAESGLTDRQREALSLALSRGYYESPRKVTAQELAEELDISQPAMSSLLRRGERELLSASLGTNGQLNTLSV
ncbi:helix-turn-helix domain-containing protein [Halobaculum magnesiiphilum]|uniref:Helix-turn-helix domain-containing protein n=1 Tax=Halobaculum magnesiiphilum TaxID=1017351 RepID=A0A8T8WI23_9EURY|nr:helix-turn-helix domain-containing protein [Halobaculum magnesiiphilum]QZP39500.1 helix-turn-helix domain-containing protein [Halobaculum magnesiiphilum]